MTGFANDADKAIYTKLAANTALTSLLSGGTASPSVFRALAPEGTATPYVVFQTQSPSTPIRVIGGVALENALYTVKGITEGRSAALGGTIAAAIDAALDGPPLTYTGHSHAGCTRVQDVDYPEPLPGGRLLQHRGGIYRITADPT